MIDIFLIIVTVVVFCILSVLSVYFLIHFQHPDDKNEAWLPKFVVLFGLVLSGSTVLLLPLDVANNGDYVGCDSFDTKICGGLNMNLFWNVMYMLILICLTVLIPFSTFYYEADDGMLMAGTSVETKPNSRICEAVKYQIFVILIVGGIFTGCYFAFGETAIPVVEYTGTRLEMAADYTSSASYNANGTLNPFSLNSLNDMTQDDSVNSAENEKTAESTTINLQVDVPTFFTAMMAFVGWFLFALFGGIGIASLPLTFLLTYINRPKHMSPTDFADAQMSLRERVNDLVDIGELVQLERDEDNELASASSGKKKWFSSRADRKSKNEQKKMFREYRAAVYLMENDMQAFQDATSNYADYNPLIPYAALLAGIVSIILSIFWLLQIVLFVLPTDPIHPLLNDYFQWFDSWFPLFGVLSVAVFCLYILLCAVKGCFQFGLRFLFFTLHPMTPNKTYMSSFLFNVGLILLCVTPVIQFSTAAFAYYARYTTSLQRFGVQVKYLQFFKYFFEKKVFEYAFVAISVLTSLFLMCKPKDSSKDSVGLRDRLKGRRG